MKQVLYFILMCIFNVIMLPFIIREEGRKNRKFLYDEWKSARTSYEIDTLKRRK